MNDAKMIKNSQNWLKNLKNDQMLFDRMESGVSNHILVNLLMQE